MRFPLVIYTHYLPPHPTKSPRTQTGRVRLYLILPSPSDSPTPSTRVSIADRRSQIDDFQNDVMLMPRVKITTGLLLL